MSEITIPKRPKLRYAPEVFKCVDCGVDVERANASHKRCPECSADNLRTFRQRDFERRFPVVYEPMMWICRYLNDNPISGEDVHQDRKEATDRRMRENIRIDLKGPSPCKGCRYYDSCAEGTMCKSFYVWSDESNKDVKVWGKRNNPCGKYYWRSFPRDIKPETMRRVK
jgi:DNA-directed RNA polymerase subunit RPC12/RpoP